VLSWRALMLISLKLRSVLTLQSYASRRANCGF
jgi:hypothetical protein